MAGAALPIIGTGLSAIGTVSGMFDQGGTNEQLTRQSFEQMDYLKKRQKQKEALVLEVTQRAKEFAAYNYDQELQALENQRALQEEQANQQRIIAEQNFIKTQGDIQEERTLSQFNDITEDFTNQLSERQSKFSRDIGSLGRHNQYRTNELGRKLSDAQTDSSLKFSEQEADLGRLQGETSFGISEKERQAQGLQDQYSSDSGREEALLDYMRGNDQLTTDRKILDIKEAGVNQTHAYQTMSQDLQNYQQLLGLEQNREVAQKKASSDKRLSRQMTNSDYRSLLESQQLESLVKAQDLASKNNQFMKGSLNNQLDINMSEIGMSRLGLQQTQAQLQTQLENDRIKRESTLAYNNMVRQFGSNADKINTLMLPEVARQMSLNQQKVGAAGNKLTNQFNRQSDQYGITQDELVDEFSEGNENALRNVNKVNTDINRMRRESSFNQQGIDNQKTYEQALLDLYYGGQQRELAYDLGKSTSEQARYSNEQSLDMETLQNLAAQKTELSNKLSQLQGLMGYTGTGGTSMLDGLSSLVSQGSGLFSTLRENEMTRQRYASNNPSATTQVPRYDNYSTMPSPGRTSGTNNYNYTYPAKQPYMVVPRGNVQYNGTSYTPVVPMTGK